MRADVDHLATPESHQGQPDSGAVRGRMVKMDLGCRPTQVMKQFGRTSHEMRCATRQALILAPSRTLGGSGTSAAGIVLNGLPGFGTKFDGAAGAER